MTIAPGTVLLGTVALEPNRWSTVDPSGRPSATLSTWLPAVAEAGFDGIELWEGHVTRAAEAEAEAVLAGPLPVAVFNTYAAFDDGPEPTAARAAAARWIVRTDAAGVKFNVGLDHDAAAYGERVGAWRATLPAATTLLCECHAGISIAQDPAVAAAFLAAAGPADRVQAIVHTHEDADHLRARFDAYGDRITHVHVNHLEPAAGRTSRLADVRDRFAATVAVLDELGFRGSWTVEFVDGLLSERDRPELLVAQAAADLRVLRDVLREVIG